MWRLTTIVVWYGRLWWYLMVMFNTDEDLRSGDVVVLENDEGFDGNSGDELDNDSEWVKVHKNGRNEMGSEPCLVGDLKVQVNGGDHKSLEDTVKDASEEVEKRIMVMGKEKALRKVME
ncbi:hypothetical protein F0562_017959 [Nyssa sinensis]|uniref:Uncharacterized protein n=1 Tax=Nyssa sinensis TaxID=561372 RepID=A0A5J4Z8Q7_9ASTE|nr:hypothetical protein F0562_017959 [Nyssa sinensis]